MDSKADKSQRGLVTSVRLSDVGVGAAVIISGLSDPDGTTAARLEHMGFIPGTTVRVERRAPLGDPTVYELRGYRLALRRESAALVDVHPATAGATDR